MGRKETTPFEIASSVAESMGKALKKPVDFMIESSGHVNYYPVTLDEPNPLSLPINSPEKSNYYKSLNAGKTPVFPDQTCSIRHLLDTKGHWKRTTKKGNPTGPGSYSSRQVPIKVKAKS